MNVKELAKEQESYVIQCRHYLHSHPELSTKEVNTTRFIKEELENMGVEVQEFEGITGCVGTIKGDKPGKTVMLRADIDALPITENPGKSYCSLNPGVMHACGHDAHTAVLLGAATVLASMKDELHGSVKLFFQPAEETIGGAERMIAAGCLENPHVDYTLGLHVSPDLPAGQIGIKYGQMYAASDMLTLKIYGKSCHGAHPDEGVDAIVIAANIINTVQTFVSRNVSATDSAVCTFGTIQGGNVRNQIADYVEMTGIIRTLDPQMRMFARERVRTICEQTAAMLGGRAELIVEPSYSPLINDDAVVDTVRETAAEILGAENVILRKVPSLGVEDFAYFAAERPSCFYHLGCAADDPKRCVAHSRFFDIDEACIPVGIELQVASVLALMNR